MPPGGCRCGLDLLPHGCGPRPKVGAQSGLGTLLGRLIAFSIGKKENRRKTRGAAGQLGQQASPRVVQTSSKVGHPTYGLISQPEETGAPSTYGFCSFVEGTLFNLMESEAKSKTSLSGVHLGRETNSCVTPIAHFFCNANLPLATAGKQQ